MKRLPKESAPGGTGTRSLWPLAVADATYYTQMAQMSLSSFPPGTFQYVGSSLQPALRQVVYDTCAPSRSVYAHLPGLVYHGAAAGTFSSWQTE